VIATTLEWQLNGTAFIVPADRADGEPVVLSLSQLPDSDWCEVVEILPSRLQIHPVDPALLSETIDIQEINPE